MTTPLIRGTREQISSLIRADVLSGRLAAGERLSEAKLAERFGVSRGPIREALAELSNEGLLVAKPNCGVTVAPPAPAAVRELLLPVRRTLETFALRHAFTRFTDDDFRAWDDILSRMERAAREQDVAQHTQLDVALHRSILEKAGQPDVLAIWQAVIARLRGHFWDRAARVSCEEGWPRLYQGHVRLVAAIRSGDLDHAIRELEAHIDDN